MPIDAPYYLHRPSQIVRRLLGASPPVRLPWGQLIDCDASEAIGCAIVRNGIYDLAVTEFLWRLTDPGDVCIDVGGHIGHMTSVLAHRAGSGGLVLSFEPNPTTRERLSRNVRGWTEGAVIEVRSTALSSRVGVDTLAVDPNDLNDASAHLGAGITGIPSVAGFEIHLDTLDNATEGRPIGVMKVDVEGHELAVLEGGKRALTSGQIRDIVYEDHPRYPSKVSRLLESHRYTIFAIRERFWGPWLADASEAFPPMMAPNYLATLDPARARQRLRERGWKCLHG